jgi:hypothetical protein
MKFATLITASALLLASCNSSDVEPRPNDQDGVERICTTEDLGQGPVEICICKTATEATDCPA